jgi:hypothetical protein
LRGSEGNVLLSKEGRPLTDVEPYTFTGGTRLKLAQLARTLTPLGEAINKRRQELFPKIQPAAADTSADEKKRLEEETAAAMKKANEDLVAFLEEEVEISGSRNISTKDLEIDKNHLPPPIVTNLFPILTDGGGDPKPS